MSSILIEDIFASLDSSFASCCRATALLRRRSSRELICGCQVPLGGETHTSTAIPPAHIQHARTCTRTHTRRRKYCLAHHGGPGRRKGLAEAHGPCAPVPLAGQGRHWRQAPMSAHLHPGPPHLQRRRSSTAPETATQRRPRCPRGARGSASVAARGSHWHTGWRCPHALPCRHARHQFAHAAMRSGGVHVSPGTCDVVTAAAGDIAHTATGTLGQLIHRRR